MKNLFAIITVLMLSFIIVNADSKTLFSDVTPNDEAFNALVKYHEKAIFNGINWEARLDDVISKLNASIFLAKLLGKVDPTVQDIIDMEILSKKPTEGELLNNATWIKMLSSAFDVPLWKTDANQPWFVAPYVVAQSIMAVSDEKPFDISSRRFLLKTSEIYERVFTLKTAMEIMDEQENRLMKIRDLLINPESNYNTMDKLLWENFIQESQAPDSSRMQSIKYLNMALLSLLDMHRDPNVSKKMIRQSRVKFFINQANNVLPEVKPFSEDLLKISQK